MPGLSGALFRDGSAGAPEAVDGMAASIRHRAWYTDERATSDSFACAIAAPDDNPRIAENERCILAIDGTVYGETTAIAINELIREYGAKGVIALQGLNGSYTIAVYDKAQRRLYLISDRFGYRPMYYTQLNGALYFAAEHKAFLGLEGFRSTLRMDSLAQYLQFTFVMGEETLLADVYRLPPASCLAFDGESAQIETYEDLEIDHPQESSASIDDLASEYAHLIEAAVRRRVGPRNVMLLTGGLDSRCLAGNLAKHTDPAGVRSCTMGYPRCYDVRFGRQLAQTLGFSYAHIPVEPSYVADYGETGVERLDGNLSAHGFWSFAADEFLEEGRVNTVIHGLLGDALAGVRALREREAIVSMEEAAAIDYMYTRFFATTFSDEDLKTLLKPAVHDETVGAARKVFAQHFSKAPGESFYDRLEYVELRQRQRHFTAQQVNIYDGVARCETPFTDRDVVDCAFHLPQPMRMDKRMYKHMIRKHLPQVTGVPYTATGLPLDDKPAPTALWRLRNAWHYRVLPKISMGLIPHVHFGVWIQYDRWLREGSQDYVRAIVAEGPYLEDVFEMDTVRRWVDDHMAGRGNYYGQLCALLTIALWRKRFGA